MISKTTKPFLAGLIVLFLGSFVVTFFNLYDTFPYIDKVFHVTGGFIVAWFFDRFWSEKLNVFHKLEHLVVLVAITALVGFFWEIAEFSTSIPPFVDNILLRHYFYGGSLVDTLGDLTADIFGAVLFYLFKR